MILLPGGIGFQAATVRLWTPANLADKPGLWVNDASAVTDAGSGACSQWNDISGNSYHLTQATSADRPLIISSGLNGRRTIRFDGTSDRMANTGMGARGLFRDKPAGWALMVYKKTASDGSPKTRTIFCAPNGTDGSSRFVLDVGGSSAGQANKPRLLARRLDGDSTGVLAASTAYATSWLMAIMTMDWSQGDGTIYINGAQDAQNLSLTSSGNTSNSDSTQAITLGAYENSNPPAVNFADVEVAEFVTDGGYFPTSPEIDKLFGYAAHRWGLTSSLPGGHPYKTSPPTL